MFRYALKPWRIALVVTLVTLLAFGTSLSLFGASVAPDVWSGNDPSVAEFVAEYDPDCDNVLKAKYDYGTPGNLDDGTFYDGDFSVDIEFGNQDGSEYESVSFSNASHPVLGVFVKGGPDGGNMYEYDPGVYSDTNLVTPTSTGISHVSFYYCLDEPEYGSLKVTKEVIGSDSDMDFDFTITGPDAYSVQRTIADGESFTLTDLVPGTYTVTEDTSAFGTVWSEEYEVVVGAVAAGEDNEVDVIVDRESQVLVKNTYTEPVGSLTINKEVLGDTSNLSELPIFTVTVTGPGDYEDTRAILDGGSYTLVDLKPGIYTVTEDTSGFSSEWLVEIDVISGEVVDGEEGEVEVFADQESEVTVKNTYDEIEEQAFGSLTVYKDVFGDTSGLSELPDFDITVTGTDFEDTQTIADGDSYTWFDLEPGIYTVTEDTTGFSSEWMVEIDVISGEVVDGEEGEVEVFEDLESEVSVKNTYTEEESFGSLTVNKDVFGDTSGLDEMPIFNITVTGPDDFEDTQAIEDGESYTWENLATGKYYVSEDMTELGDEWTVAYEVIVGAVADGMEGEVEVIADRESEVDVENTYDEIEFEALGSLTVHKVVAGDVDELDELPEFHFTVTGPNDFSDTKVIAAGESYTWHDLEAGMYKVTEDKTKLGTGWTVKGEGDVEVEDDLESEITVTNTYSDLPDTGGDPYSLALSGMILAGMGAVIRRRR